MMLKICEEFAISHSMEFSTDPIPSKSKTKCLFFSKLRTLNIIKNVKLNGNELPWVNSAKHLGNYLSTQLSYAPLAPEMSTDLRCKRAMVFDSVNQVKQKFGAFDPKLVLRLLSVYSTALSGSPPGC